MQPQPDVMSELAMKRSRQAAVLLLLSGLLIAATIVYGGYRLADSQKQIDALDRSIEQRKTELTTLEAQLAKKKLELEAVNTMYGQMWRSSPQLASQIRAAETKAFEAVPAAAAAIARVYLHISEEAQRPFAQEMAKQLRARDFRVAGIELVKTWRGAAITEVRYFTERNDQAEKTDLSSIATPLKSAGLAPLERFVRSSGRVPPRQYEIWFGRDVLTPSAGPGAP